MQYPQSCVTTKFLLLLLVCWISTPVGNAAEVRRVASGRQGMVVSVSPPATEIGVQVLQNGGTAVDAAVAVAFALQVTWPEAGNIGGGGFMLVHPGPQQAPVCIEYRETAPGSATPEMFQLGETHLGHKVAGVPGTVRGLALAHRKYGKRPWPDLIAPSVRLARNGFAVDESLAKSLNGVLSASPSAPFVELRRVYGKADGTPWKSGEILIQPELAQTLELIAQQGPDAFYAGRIAQQVVAEMQAGGGLISLSDLDAYEARIREPVHVSFRGHDIYGPPPPSSGGICLAEMLNIVSHFDLRSQGRWSADTVQILVEAMKRAYCDRARYIGDPDFAQVPLRLTSRDYAQQLAHSIRLDHATPSRELAPELEIAGESPSTTHFSVIDGAGMAVSNTYTLEQSFGCRVVVRGAGFLLNNEMGDFNWKEGHTDESGNIGTAANLIAPRKRMLSSQTPVLVLKQGETVLATGSPGGRTIINTVLCVVLNVLEFEMDLPSAVSEPRLHHQWLPDQVRLEQGDQERFMPLVQELRQRGQTVIFGSAQGDAHSIQREPQTGQLLGVADHRRSGSAAGY